MQHVSHILWLFCTWLLSHPIRSDHLFWNQQLIKSHVQNPTRPYWLLVLGFSITVYLTLAKVAILNPFPYIDKDSLTLKNSYMNNACIDCTRENIMTNETNLWENTYNRILLGMFPWVNHVLISGIETRVTLTSCCEEDCDN